MTHYCLTQHFLQTLSAEVSMLLHASGAAVQSPDSHHRLHLQSTFRLCTPDRRNWRCACLSESINGRKQLSWGVQEPQSSNPHANADGSKELVGEVLESGRTSGRRTKTDVLPPHENPDADLDNWQGEVPFGYTMKDG